MNDTSFCWIARKEKKVMNFFGDKGRLFLAGATLALAGLARPAVAQTITEFPLPNTASHPYEIAIGPGGDLWFTEVTPVAIGRISTDGTITEFPIPRPYVFLGGIVAGPDGNLWFTESDSEGGTAALIGRITPGGAVTEFPLSNGGYNPCDITAGPDGNLWFTECSIGGNAIGRITTAGVITEFPLPTRGPGYYPYAITSGPDGNLWFTEPNRIGRITTEGIITEFSIAGSPALGGITSGPDGNLWFTEFTGKIGRITTAGVITEFAVPTGQSLPFKITAGPDGNLWFTELYGNKIGRITTAGAVKEFPVPTAGSGPAGITVGPDGNIWFTESNKSQIGRISLITPVIYPCVPAPDHLCSLSLMSGRFQISVSASDADSGVLAVGQAVPQGDEFGYFSLPQLTGDPALPEVVVKMADATSLSPGGGWFWVFYSALTSLPYEITVTDTATGQVRTYWSDGFCGGADTSAFPGGAAAGAKKLSTVRTTLSASGDTLSLLGNRFQATLTATNPRGGTTAPGAAIPQGDRFGYFSLPAFTGNPNFPEVFVKMIDATSLPGGDFWLFHTGLTDLRYTLTVTDSVTGAVKTYQNDPSDPARLCGGADTAFSMTPTSPPAARGKIAFVSSRDGNPEIYTINTDGTNLTRLTNDPAVDEEPAWSPDGQRIAFVSERSGNYELYVMNADGSGVVRRTFSNSYTQNPSWSPDGTKIAYSTLSNGSANLWVVSPNAGGPGPTLLFEAPGWDAQPSWSPDGTKLALVSDWYAYDFVYDIFLINADGSGFTGLTGDIFVDHVDYLGPSWSPNGATIAHVVNERVGFDQYITTLAVMNADGTGRTPLISAATWAKSSWSPDGQVIAFTSGTTNALNVSWVAADGSASGLIVSNGWNPSWRPVGSGAGQAITEFVLPVGGSPQGITAGPDGSLWLTEISAQFSLSGMIGRITTEGVVIEISQPLYPQPKFIVTGPDGNLWFTQDDSCDNGFSSVGRMTPAGVLTEFWQPFCRVLGDITVGPDGNLWFTWNGQSVPFVFSYGVSRITPTGVVTDFPVPRAVGIAAGPDGAIWFTEGGSVYSGEGGLDRIGRVTATGAVSEFALPAGSAPTGIAAGPDGNLWFTESSGNKIGHMTTTGTVTEFPIPTPGSRPMHITHGPDGNLWFTEELGNRIGRITTAGAITEFPIPLPDSRPFDITSGPDGNIWFTHLRANSIGRLNVVRAGPGPQIPKIVPTPRGTPAPIPFRTSSADSTTGNACQRGCEALLEQLQ